MKYFIPILAFFIINVSFCQSTIGTEEIKAIYFKAERQKISKNYPEAITLYSKIINAGNSKYLAYSYMGRGNCKSWIK